MFKKVTIAVLAAGLVIGPLPAGATNMFDSVFQLHSEFSTLAQTEEAGQGLEIASLDKEKPPKPDQEEKESKSKKKYDDFKDKNKNGIDDRFEKPARPGKDLPKRKKKGEPGEMNF